jgi:hypothetical protein
MYKTGRYITSEIAIITLIKPEEDHKEKGMREAIIRELRTNPFWRRWKIEKVTLLEGAQTEPKIEA